MFNYSLNIIPIISRGGCQISPIFLARTHHDMTCAPINLQLKSLNPVEIIGNTTFQHKAQDFGIDDVLVTPGIQ